MANRSTDDAIFTAFHSDFTHLENNITLAYVRMLFVDFILVVNTSSLMKVIGKLEYQSQQLDTGLHHMQTPDNLVWHSHLLQSSFKNHRPIIQKTQEDKISMQSC